MYGWVVDELGDFSEKLHWREIPKPECPEKGTIVRVKAAGINFLDILAIAGTYQVKPTLPFVPGVELVGEVMEPGRSSRFKEGDRIVSMTDFGAFAEIAACSDGSSLLVAEDIPHREAAAMFLVYQTAYFAFVHRAGLKAGETLLVHGGAGGVGTAAIQLGKAMGATVIATAGSPQKLEVCTACGADHVINYTSQDFVSLVKEITAGKGADVVFDPVGGEVFDKSTKCIAWEGRIVVTGFASGKIPTAPLNHVLVKNYSVVGLYWGAYFLRDPQKIEEAQRKLHDFYSRGLIRPVLYGNYRLNQLPEALNELRTRRAYGKIVLASDPVQYSSA